MWLLNDTTVKALRKLKDNNGNYIWQPSVQAGVPDMILNRPYHTSSYVQEVAAGSKVMAFGDFSYYWIADRQGRSFKPAASIGRRRSLMRRKRYFSSYGTVRR